LVCSRSWCRNCFIISVVYVSDLGSHTSAEAFGPYHSFVQPPQDNRSSLVNVHGTIRHITQCNYCPHSQKALSGCS
jgi:hypothetical protein